MRDWQSLRLAATYVDFSVQPRYEQASRFFFEELYGTQEFSRRRDAVERLVPTLSRLLPKGAVETVTLAMDLEALTEDLDHRVAAALPAGEITEATYAEANREAVSRGERDRQVDLMVAVGERLDALVRKPLVLKTLELMRQPARAARLSGLQGFLERGFRAFRAMDGAGEFLAALQEREAAILDGIYGKVRRARSA